MAHRRGGKGETMRDDLRSRRTRVELIVAHAFAFVAHALFAIIGAIGGAVLLGMASRLVWKSLLFGWHLWQ